MPQKKRVSAAGRKRAPTRAATTKRTPKRTSGAQSASAKARTGKGAAAPRRAQQTTAARRTQTSNQRGEAKRTTSKPSRREPASSRAAAKGARHIPAIPAAVPPLPRPLERELKDTAIRGRHDEAIANMRLALDAYDRGEATRALRAARAAKEAAPRSPSVREALGLIYQSLGSPKEALSELQAARRMSGSQFQIAAIADCLITLGRPDRALEELAGLSKPALPPEVWADAQVARAKAHEMLGNIDAAVGVLRNADEWPSNPQAPNAAVRYALADTLARAGQREEARRLFVRIALWNRDYRDVFERAR